MNLNSDMWRLHQLQCYLANSSHPYHKFGIGTNQTLLDKNGTSTREGNKNDFISSVDRLL